LVKLNRIYTRTGDTGSAGLVDGSRVSKASLRMAAIGDVDEANAAIGLAIAEIGGGDVATGLRLVQNELFDLGADVATPGEVDGALRIVDTQVTRLEREIDAMNDTLAPLNSFILPGGSSAVAALHLARAIVRRAERSAVALNAAEPLNPQLLAYLDTACTLRTGSRGSGSGIGKPACWRDCSCNCSRRASTCSGNTGGACAMRSSNCGSPSTRP